MKISVTDDHILHGNANCGDGCPIWLAVDGRMDPSWRVVVTPVRADFTPVRAEFDIKTYYVVASLPRSARNFIRDFDTGQPVAPFEFELPEPWRVFE